MNRRHFLTGLAGILASGVAPAVLPAGSIMRVKPVLLPGIDFHPDAFALVVPLRAMKHIDHPPDIGALASIRETGRWIVWTGGDWV